MRPGYRKWAFAALLAGWMAAGGGTGCFNPDKPACAFSCAEPPGTCPTGFVCGADKLCHDPTSTAACRITIVSDAAADAGVDAAAADSATGAGDAAPDSGTGG